MRFAHPITTVTALPAKKNTEKLFEDDSANELRAPALQSWLAEARQAGNAQTR